MSGPLVSRLIYLPVALIVVGLDWLTKRMVEARLSPGETHEVVSGLFDLTFVKNPGGVFGILKGLPGGARSVLFVIVPTAAILFILLYSLRTPLQRWVTHLSLALILGGAVGNLADRIRLGYVVDFFDVYWRQHHWPAFNVADSAICIGVGLLVLEMFLEAHPGTDSSAAEPPVEGNP